MFSPLYDAEVLAPGSQLWIARQGRQSEVVWSLRVTSMRRGIRGTQVPRPLSPRSRGRVAEWDAGAEADVGQRYRTLTTETSQQADFPRTTHGLPGVKGKDQRTYVHRP